jgi:ketosteroid isomerase-like protein
VFNSRMAAVLCVMGCLLAGALAVSNVKMRASQESESEKTLWNLERGYWQYVQANDLTAYERLWHKDFLGWPSVSAAPVRKDHITDWITSQTAQGLKFQTVEFRPASIQVTGEIGVACYWMTFKWVDKDGKGEPRSLRVFHTWVKEGTDWRIISGMSMPEAAAPQK